MTKDGIYRSESGIVFSGSDAVTLYAVTVLRSAIRLHKKTGMLPRGARVAEMFAYASRFTGQTYKRGEHDRAIADLDVWIETMASALPIEDEGDKS